MTAFVEIKGVRVAFGVVWKRIDPKKAKAEVAALVRRHRAAYQINLTEYVGVAPQPRKGAEPKQKESVVSGAAMFASCMAGKNKNAVLVLPLDEKHSRYAFIALVDGAPYLDLVLASTNVGDRMESLKQEGHGSYAEFGSHPNFPAAQALSVADLLDKHAQRALMSKAVVRRPRNAVALRAALAALAVVGVYGWYYTDLQAEKEAAAQQVQVDPVAEYKNAIQAVLASPAPLGSDVYDAVWMPLAKQDTAVKGFEAQKVTCNRTGCAEDWKRNGGSNDVFIAQFPADTRFDFGLNGAVSLDKTVILREHKSKVTPIVFASLPRREDFWVQLTSEAQKRKYEPDLLGGLQPISYALTAPKIVGNSAGVPKALHLEMGTYQIDGPLALLRESLTTMHANMRVDEITVDISGGEKTAKFTVKGIFYVKN
jgi:hypothetical protein